MPLFTGSDPRLLRRVLRHRRRDTYTALAQARGAFPTTDVQTHALFSTMERQFHGASPPPPPRQTGAAFAAPQSQLTVIPSSSSPDNDKDDYALCVPASFHHFLMCGVAYYSYVFARAFPEQTWKQRFEHDAACKKGGRRLRSFRAGATKDARHFVADLIDGDVTFDALLDYADPAGVTRSRGAMLLRCRVGRTMRGGESAEFVA